MKKIKFPIKQCKKDKMLIVCCECGEIINLPETTKIYKNSKNGINAMPLVYISICPHCGNQHMIRVIPWEGNKS